MTKFLFILCSLVVISKLAAQNSDYTDISAFLENKIWKVKLPQGKQYAMEMEFRDAGWKKTFIYDEKQTEKFYSYSFCGDTIKVFDSGEGISFKNVFFRKTKGKLIAHTSEKNLETGVPVCFLNERGDTIVPYGKYKYCQINRVKNLVFA